MFGGIHVADGSGMSRFRALLGLVFPALVACETSIIQDPNCEAAPSCEASEVVVDECSNASCHEVELCGQSILCEVSDQDCLALPVCDGSDVEVEACETKDCYEVTTCGVTILCASDCQGLFDCDPGDTPVDGCNDDSVCYTVEVCGELIECQDDLLPAHGCPLSEPDASEACDPGAPPECTYPTSESCVSFYSCEDGAWTWVGGGCEE